jgi:hypothetical protein
VNTADAAAPAMQITVAIALHASSRWVDTIVANVRALPPLVTEVIVSDRSCVDDAARQVRARLADDPRVRVIAEASGWGWERHYQWLIEQARGEFFMWMPHDDYFPSDWVPCLAETLQAHPHAWLAFGRIELVEIDGRTPTALPDMNVYAPGPVTTRQAVDALIAARMGVPFRGLCRRQPILDAGIRMRAWRWYRGADQLWNLAVAVRGGMVHDPRTTTRKRMFAESLSAGFRTPAWGRTWHGLRQIPLGGTAHARLRLRLVAATARFLLEYGEGRWRYLVWGVGRLAERLRG